MVLANIGIVLMYFASVWSRKYDLDGEALKLYREDLETVVQRFRRSPEYIKILKDRIEANSVYLADFAMNFQEYYSELLVKKVKEMYIKEKDKKKDTTPECEPSEKINDRRRRLKKKGIGRQEDTKENMTRVERLDSYSMLTSPLSIKEKNNLRDLGFQYAGYVIHAVIQSMGSEGEAVSTQNPYGGGEPEETTTSKSHGAYRSASYQATRLIARTPPTMSDEDDQSQERVTMQSRFKKRHRMKKSQ